MSQLPLFPSQSTVEFPSTRYQGSKRKLLKWIWENLQTHSFQTVLDVFGGTGSVSYLFKQRGKQVIYNDHLRFNQQIGKALIENSRIRLSPQQIDQLMLFHPHFRYPDYIQQTFQGIYFTDEENRWLDRVIYNITQLLSDPYQQALAYFALFQACIIKRPYNLFHRANLYMREAQVERSFGNKTTWDTPFEHHFRAMLAEANQAIFDNGQNNQALCLDALLTPTGSDLVYLDPPYLNQKGVGVNYRDFYHFLEGIMNYDYWSDLIDLRSKHRRLRPISSPWQHPDQILSAFEQVIAHHQHSLMVISYRNDGIPTQAQLIDLLSAYKREVKVIAFAQQYALSKQPSSELLLIGHDQA
ncbi:MAG: DNA adenine methylase [Anaerolineae bacterium]|nr:DNA adenine methylase [Anaerolineae bacterium]